MPATDTAADTAFIPSLCGPRTYTIVEAQPAVFITILQPASDQYTNAWTLNALSNSLIDVGVWSVTLQVVLVNYPTIFTTQMFTATVLDPCHGTIIQPFTLIDMNVSIYDITP